ncbi:hypothetical protein [Streptacidiphilus albus]|uniref:hypothetical protein n=1 Tax=Streptacidiphilus albus TaxID=105425 RepID=UPI00128B5BD9|nr:hypothetical protein [Streptacidiphilus albus]
MEDNGLPAPADTVGMLALANSLEDAGDWAGAAAWIEHAAEGGRPLRDVPLGRAASGAGADSGVHRLVVPLGKGR